MATKFIGSDWDGSCPKCGKDNLVHEDIDYDISLNGYVAESFECENCGQKVTAIWSLTFKEASYESLYDEPENFNSNLDDKSIKEKMKLIRKVLPTYIPDHL